MKRLLLLGMGLCFGVACSAQVKPPAVDLTGAFASQSQQKLSPNQALPREIQDWFALHQSLPLPRFVTEEQAGVWQQIATQLASMDADERALFEKMVPPKKTPAALLKQLVAQQQVVATLRQTFNAATPSEAEEQGEKQTLSQLAAGPGSWTEKGRAIRDAVLRNVANYPQRAVHHFAAGLLQGSTLTPQLAMPLAKNLLQVVAYAEALKAATSPEEQTEALIGFGQAQADGMKHLVTYFSVRSLPIWLSAPRAEAYAQKLRDGSTGMGNADAFQGAYFTDLDTYQASATRLVQGLFSPLQQAMASGHLLAWLQQEARKELAGGGSTEVDTLAFLLEGSPAMRVLFQQVQQIMKDLVARQPATMEAWVARLKRNTGALLNQRGPSASVEDLLARLGDAAVFQWAIDELFAQVQTNVQQVLSQPGFLVDPTPQVAPTPAPGSSAPPPSPAVPTTPRVVLPPPPVASINEVDLPSEWKPIEQEVRAWLKKLGQNEKTRWNKLLDDFSRAGVDSKTTGLRSLFNTLKVKPFLLRRHVRVALLADRAASRIAFANGLVAVSAGNQQLFWIDPGASITNLADITTRLTRNQLRGATTAVLEVSVPVNAGYQTMQLAADLNALGLQAGSLNRVVLMLPGDEGMSAKIFEKKSGLWVYVQASSQK